MTTKQQPYRDMRFDTFRPPEMSEWQCYLFGGRSGGYYISWRPAKGEEPNWFWRKMQWLIFGNLWVKDK